MLKSHCSPMKFAKCIDNKYSTWNTYDSSPLKFAKCKKTDQSAAPDRPFDGPSGVVVSESAKLYVVL